MNPHEIVEAALSQRTVDAMTVICAEHSQTNLRWAANTLTTNGVMRSRDVTVVAVHGSGSGRATGVMSASVADSTDLAAIVARAEASARSADPSPDAHDLVAGDAGDDFAEAPAQTSPDVFSSFAPELGHWFGRARGHSIELFGFAEHDITTTYIGNSQGLRLRHAQPTGRVEITGKSHGRSRSTCPASTSRCARDWAGLNER
jgi:predicted Zn-dependent protease